MRVHAGGKALAEGLVQGRIADDQARLEQRSLHRDVALRLGDAFGQGAHRRADLQPGIPAVADEAFQLALELRVMVRSRAVWHQQQHIDIRMRKQFAAAITAHGHQGETRREAGHLPQVLQALVGCPGQLLEQAADTAGRGALGLQRGHQLRLAGPQGLAQGLQLRHSRTAVAAGCRPTA